MQGMVPLSGFGGVPYSAVRKAAPRNLLDNSDFTNPVNQRGKTSYSNPGYSIDRWKITNNYSSMTVDDDGVTFSANGGMCYPQQLIVANANMVGKTFTAAICLKDGSVTVTSGVLTALSPASNTLIGNRAAITNGNGAELAMYARTDGNLMIQPHIPDGVSLGLRWAALYEGEYTAETLPEYHPKGYGAELAECQRYYVASDGYFYLNSNPDGVSRVSFYVPNMRVIPTVSFLVESADNAVVNVQMIAKNAITFWSTANNGFIRVLAIELSADL